MSPADYSKVLNAAYALNQDIHCYDHKPAVFRLLCEQTKLLLEAIEAVKAAAAQPAPPAQDPATVLDWKDPTVALPDDCLTVLIACDDGEVDSAYLIKGKHWIWQSGHEVAHAVIGWCNLPAAPQKKEVKP